ncbi:uncharacterized protein LOC124420390 [Lucilia cuprina]|uniref:uncharacterized protein LOC124420390 n=1 Tax=Lucilia cuprina TaxID=7375 RepID=UPI001F05C0F7|nr:uncharacterized protein LOC124420390 [Lucilia cuprina]KAI8123013.1 hypothetical protein CVS40_6074 [Lucilia cuprina]
MANICKSLKELSSQGHWDEVFSCLNIESNSTIELASFKIPKQQNDLWLDEHMATLNSLEVILGFILLCDQIFYILLLLYLGLFMVKFLRKHIYTKLKKCISMTKMILKRYQYVKKNKN